MTLLSAGMIAAIVLFQWIPCMIFQCGPDAPHDPEALKRSPDRGSPAETLPPSVRNLSMSVRFGAARNHGPSYFGRP